MASNRFRTPTHEITKGYPEQLVIELLEAVYQRISSPMRTNTVLYHLNLTIENILNPQCIKSSYSQYHWNGVPTPLRFGAQSTWGVFLRAAFPTDHFIWTYVSTS